MNLEIEQVELWASECSTAAVQLVRSGLFPCSPIYPTLAVDIRVLDFVRRLFLRIAPNYTAWCGAASDFLAAQGFYLPGDDPLRRRFANALQWFMSLNDMATTSMDAVLQRVREELVPASSTAAIQLSPHAHCDDTPPTPTEEEHASPTKRRVSVEEVVSEDSDMRDTRKRGREESDEEDPSEPSSPHSERSDLAEEIEKEREFHSPLSRPTEYLRSRCLACFGGDW